MSPISSRTPAGSSIVPGYGLAVAQAQHDVRELADLLEERGIEVKYAIHPVAGRMPGHMNVLLAEANVPYRSSTRWTRSTTTSADRRRAGHRRERRRPTRPRETTRRSPIYGMPILDVDKAASSRRAQALDEPGFAGIDNTLYLEPKTTMLFGDAKESVLKLISAVKAA